MAEIDCTLSIELDPKYSKAYFRRANARIKLNRIEDAKRDYEQVLKLEPNNKEAQAELIKVEELIEGHKRVFPIQKSEAQRSKKPLRLIEIEQINSDSINKLEINKNLEEMKQRTKLDAKEEILFKAYQMEITQNENKETKRDSKIKIEELTQRLENSDLKSAKEMENKTESAPSQTVESKLENKNSKPTKIIPDRPVNGYQFKKDWQFLSDNIENLAVYLRVFIFNLEVF